MAKPPGLPLIVERPLEREHDVLGGELRAVVKLHAATQLELPRERIGRRPRGRDARNDAAPLVDAHERIENVHLSSEIRLRGDEMRVERGHVGGESDAQLRCCGPGCGEDHEEQAQETLPSRRVEGAFAQ